MKYAEMNETSNREIITISRPEYEAMQAQLDAQSAELAKQNQRLDTKTAELAQVLLQNRGLMEQFASLFNEAEAWDADSVEPAPKSKRKKPCKHRSGSIDDVIPEETPVEVGRITSLYPARQMSWLFYWC